MSSLMAHQFINVFEDNDMDDLTEYVPCFKIPKTDGFHAVIYWKAELMNYQFVLITYDKAGNFIDSRTLAGTTSNGEIVPAFRLLYIAGAPSGSIPMTLV